jgi:predicted transcriptional regulator
MAELKTVSCHCCAGTGEELDHQAVGDEMRKKREARGFTQTQVAKSMRMSKAYVSDLEWGARNWRTELINKYLKALK